MPKELLIFPYSGTAIEALDCLGSEWTCVGFISDDRKKVGTEAFGYTIYDRSVLVDKPNAYILLVHGSPQSFKKRKETIDQFDVNTERFATVIHPNAFVSPRATVGHNVLIMSGVSVSSNATIGDHAIVLPNSVIHHDSYLGNYTLVGANVTIAGDVMVGEGCYLGAACSIKNGIAIGRGNLIGMAANVVKTTEDNVVMVGNPAQKR